MTSFLDILNNPNTTTDNDFCTINLVTSEITWKAGMYNPKVANDVKYWLAKRNYNGQDAAFNA